MASLIPPCLTLSVLTNDVCNEIVRHRMRMLAAEAVTRDRYNEDKTEVKMIESLSGRLGIPLEVRFVFPLVAALNQILLAVRHC